MRLAEFAFTVGDRIFYEYDFGDSWEHEIRFEKIFKQEHPQPYPGFGIKENAEPKIAA